MYSAVLSVLELKEPLVAASACLLTGVYGVMWTALGFHAAPLKASDLSLPDVQSCSRVVVPVTFAELHSTLCLMVCVNAAHP